MASWMMQILLQEVTGVPVTLETGKADVNLDFYHPDMSFGWGTSNDWPLIENSVNIHGDCRRVVQRPEDSDDGSYTGCAHVVPEVWGTQTHNLAALQQDGMIESPMGLGMIGQQGWYMPKFAAQDNPTLLTYFGLAGGQNRRKLAETFKRPTTWGDYCAEESPTKCELPDGIASRPPVDEVEAAMYFAGVSTFTGFFRFTEENDCDLHPDTCTGHIVRA